MSERTCALVKGLIDSEERGLVKVKEGREVPMFLAKGPSADFAESYKATFGAEPHTAPQTLAATV